MTAVTGRLSECVEELVREVELETIRPRFTKLRRHEVHAKSPGEMVTVADIEAERRIADGLRRLLPGTPVVGEEACASNPALLDALKSEKAWLVDPLDGTRNFIAGGDDWAVMIALVELGETTASWIWVPTRSAMYVAQQGQGATRNGEVLVSATTVMEPLKMRGAVLSRFLDAKTAERIKGNRHRFGTVTDGRYCAGIDYPNVVEGHQDFVLYWRTLPWDHAPGALLVQESGGIAARPDGTPYQPSQPGVGLLVTAGAQNWTTVHRALLGDEPE